MYIKKINKQKPNAVQTPKVQTIIMHKRQTDRLLLLMFCFQRKNTYQYSRSFFYSKRLLVCVKNWRQEATPAQKERAWRILCFHTTPPPPPPASTPRSLSLLPRGNALSDKKKKEEKARQNQNWSMFSLSGVVIIRYFEVYHSGRKHNHIFRMWKSSNLAHISAQCGSRC